VATSYDVDPEPLISRLAGPFSPADREAFRAAALDALARVPCAGEGSIYRAVAALQRQFFDSSSDARANQGARHFLSSRLAAAPPIAVDDPRVGGRDRTRFKSVR
jgi:hypothetical protein